MTFVFVFDVVVVVGNKLLIQYFDVLKLHSTGGPCEKPRCSLLAKGRL